MSNNNRDGTIYDERLVAFIRRSIDDGFARSDIETGVVMYSEEDEFEEWVLEGVVIKKMCDGCGEKVPIIDFMRNRICADFRERKCQNCCDSSYQQAFWEDYKPSENLRKSRFLDTRVKKFEKPKIKEDYLRKSDDFMDICDELGEFALIA
nr:hypothetical protein K-LCC10_0373 [Kaumoebavirus]